MACAQRFAAGLLLVLGGLTGCTGSRDSEAREARAQADPPDAAPPVDVERPAKLRDLQVTKLGGDDPRFLLSDPYRYTEKTAVLTGPGYFAATLFDGRRTSGEVAEES